MMIVTVITLASMLLANILQLVSNPDKFPKARSLVLTGSGLFFLIFAVYYHWDAYRPKVGPVGSGPDAAEIRTTFYVALVTGACYMGAGLIGWLIQRKPRTGHSKTGRSDG